MTEGSNTLSPSDFAAMASAFGYRYTRFAPAPPFANGDAPLFTGSVGLRTFPCGISACASDLTALHASIHDGYVPRSVTIALVLEGAQGRCTFGAGKELVFGPGSAALVTVVDDAREAAQALTAKRPAGISRAQIRQKAREFLGARRGGGALAVLRIAKRLGNDYNPGQPL